ncbi:DUF3298 and DUF4163 domain-containing protein [Geojedonia litorea]|uniref:DUF3298 and DUF4163 domain-containing protein n=1 Tax=Geojedonia litorea TaxID=1268269 RepID=A0ABV9N8Z1_9FLAO
MKRSILFFCVGLLLFSCKNEQPLSFNETAIEQHDAAEIEIVYPQFENNSLVASKINKSIESAIAKNIAFFDDDTLNLSLKNAIKEFDNRFKTFKNDFQDASAPWVATVNSEVVYSSTEVITIAVDSYTFTGGAHGNSVITLLNFNPENGELYTNENLFKINENFKSLAKGYLSNEVNTKTMEDGENYFFGKDFKLSENIGFNDEGVIFLYNTYEIAAYAQGITEFTIPYKIIASYLKITP